MISRKREFAYWVYAREIRDSTVLEENHEEERAKPYVITPLGSKIRRVLITGRVTQKNSEENMTRMTLADSTGNFYLTAFSNDFGNQGKIMLDSLEPNDTVMVMGRLTSFQNEGKIYFNINPEIAVKIEETALKYWNLRASHIARRKVYAIRAALKSESPTSEELIKMGYTEEESECAVRAAKNYPDYNTSDIEAVASGSQSASAAPEGDSAHRELILDYVRNNDEDGRGCRYEDILAAATNAQISQGEVDELLNTLGSDGEIFEVSLKRYKAI